jgi:hypothetical protein
MTYFVVHIEKVFFGNCVIRVILNYIVEFQKNFKFIDKHVVDNINPLCFKKKV